MRSPLLAIFLIVAVDVLGLTIMIPLLPFYAEKLGATATEVGLLIGVYAACQLISGPLLGRASDFTGRKPLLIVSQIGTLIGFLVLAFAPNLWVVFLARIIDGSTAGNLSLAQAYISDVTRPEERAKSFGVIGIAFGMGFLIGPAISGYLAKFSYQWPIFAAAALSFTSIMATTFLLPAARTSAAPAEGPGGRRLSLLQWGEYARYFRQPELATRLFQFLCFGLSFSMFTAGFPLYAERRLVWHGAPFGPEQVGFAWAYAGFLGIFLQGPMLGKMVRRFGESNLNRTGFVGYAAGYAVLAYTFNVPMLIVATTIASIGTLVRPTLTSLITQAAPREEQGVVLGLTQSLTSTAQIIGPPLAGFLIQHELLSGWGLTAAAFALAGLGLASAKSRVDAHVSQA
ncbi:MAG TPA: MFS transporter [Bryobacteraceae bacterium]|nr:MFS transporter [Bryobacteraceae bacterium]